MPSSVASEPAPKTIIQGHTFIKTSGPTGDWIVLHSTLDDASITPPEIQWLCNRRSGVGASGVVLIATEPTQSPTHTLRAWDATGEPTQRLAEAVRAGASVISARDQQDNKPTSHYVFETTKGPQNAVSTRTHIGVDLGTWQYTTPENAIKVGSDVLVMAAGLTDPRPGLGIQLHGNHVMIAVESQNELDTIDLRQMPSVEPADVASDSINFIVPDTPLIDQGMGHLQLRHRAPGGEATFLGAACASAAIAFQNWSGLKQIMLWQVNTEWGPIIVQLHDDQRISTYTQHRTVFTGTL